jgi:4-amino-4-deoxy-L-arabinose transferase-like glycosyltransferase
MISEPFSLRNLPIACKRWLIFLLCMHCALAIAYASITPYRSAGRIRFQGGAQVSDIGAPDERQHVNYILHLVRGEGFPVLDPKDPNLGENYQAHQPPLYFMLASLPARAVAPETLEQPGGYWLRFLNCMIGVMTVIGVFLLAFWSTKRDDIALLAAAFSALLPMHIALNGAISNDPLLFCLCTWTLAFCSLGVQQGWCQGIAIRIGLLAGLAMLTKTTAIALTPIIALSLLANHKIWKPSNSFRLALSTFLVLFAVAGLWWLRNLNLYGDPFAMKAFNAAFVNSPQASAFINELGAYTYWTQWVGWWTMRSFVGTFGYMDIFLPNFLYGIALLIFLVCWTLGGLRSKELVQSKWQSGMLYGFMGLVVLLFVRFNLQYFQGQARYLLPAIGPIAILFSLGWQSAFAKLPRWNLAVLVSIFLALNLYVLSILPREFLMRAAQGTQSPNQIVSFLRN